MDARELPRERFGEATVVMADAFLVDPGGTVRRAWRYANDEVPDFDELLQAARAS